HVRIRGGGAENVVRHDIDDDLQGAGRCQTFSGRDPHVGVTGVSLAKLDPFFFGQILSGLDSVHGNQPNRYGYYCCDQIEGKRLSSYARQLGDISKIRYTADQRDHNQRYRDQLEEVDEYCTERLYPVPDKIPQVKD